MVPSSATVTLAGALIVGGSSVPVIVTVTSLASGGTERIGYVDVVIKRERLILRQELDGTVVERKVPVDLAMPALVLRLGKRDGHGVVEQRCKSGGQRTAVR